MISNVDKKIKKAVNPMITKFVEDIKMNDDSYVIK